MSARQNVMSKRRILLWVVALAGLFGFRLLFGLSSEFFSEDETQIFLMGLRYHATAAWPYFGPDVVWTSSEIPGALQALLVGVPLNLVAAPEAPFILLNLLSMSALMWYAWYICQRIPSAPPWLVVGWLLTLPWTLEFSTHINNPSYVLPAAIVFFIGFFEAAPIFSTRRLHPALAHALMGFGVTWIMQIHMSWPLLLPYVFVAWVSRRQEGARALSANALAFVGGGMLPGLALLPTLLKYGVASGSGGTLRNLHPHWVSPTAAVVVLARLLSFSSLEILRFLELTTARRLLFLARHWWLTPLALIVWAVGIVQPLWMLREWLQSVSRYRDWPAMKGLVVGSALLVYTSYWFVIERATEAHAFYLLAPVAFMFAAYCWTFVDSPVWRTRAAIVLGVNIAYHAGLAAGQAPEKSLYKNRDVVAAAIRLKEPEMFGHRRPFAVDAGPAVLQDPARPFDSRQDMVVSDATRNLGVRGITLWTFTLRNQNPRVAFRTVMCQTTYRDAAGAVMDTRQTPIRNIWQPGESRQVLVNDGVIGRPFATAVLEVLDAEALLPTPSSNNPFQPR